MRCLSSAPVILGSGPQPSPGPKVGHTPTFRIKLENGTGFLETELNNGSYLVQEVGSGNPGSFMQRARVRAAAGRVQIQCGLYLPPGVALKRVITTDSGSILATDSGIPIATSS